MDGLIQELVLYWATVEDFFAFDVSRLAQPDMIVRLVIQGLLLFGSAFFSGSEPPCFRFPGSICRSCAGNASAIRRRCMPCWISPVA